VRGIYGPRTDTGEAHGVRSLIDTILFDVGGTLRTRVPDESLQRRTRQRLVAILGSGEDPDMLYDRLYPRYKAYSRWARENLVELPEAKIWTRWMLPEFPREQIEPIAPELMVLWRERSGPAVLRPGAHETIAELDRRGYRMGIISNSNSSIELPPYLEACGLARYMQVVHAFVYARATQARSRDLLAHHAGRCIRIPVSARTLAIRFSSTSSDPSARA